MYSSINSVLFPHLYGKLRSRKQKRIILPAESFCSPQFTTFRAKEKKKRKKKKKVSISSNTSHLIISQ